MAPHEIIGSIVGIVSLIASIYFCVRAEIMWRVAVNVDRKNLKAEKANEDAFQLVKKDVDELIETRKENPRVTEIRCVQLQQHMSEIFSLRLAEGDKKFDSIIRYQEASAKRQQEILDMVMGIYKSNSEWNGKNRRG